MLGLFSVSPRCLISFRDNKRLIDAYQLLITKKPVEYDYVAIDVNSFFGGAQRLAKNVTPEARRSREVARHVLHAVQQMLRRIVCRHSLLLAFDGAGTAATVHGFRQGKLTRRMEVRLQRLCGMPMSRAVEERLVKAMPLARGLVPREVVIAGTSVEGCVERKVAAWALDLACRDGAQQHTTRSLCVVGSGTLWQSMLALTPYFQGTHVLPGSTDLRHLSMNDLLAWLELSTAGQRGDTHAVTVGRTDALLLTLLCMGCEVAELPALPGASFVVLMDAYLRLRRTGVPSAKAAPLTADTASLASLLPSSGPAAGEGSSSSCGEGGEGVSATPSSPSSTGSASTSPPLQLFYELPGGAIELDLLALYVLFLPESEVAAEVAALTHNAASPFDRPAAAAAATSTSSPSSFRSASNTSASAAFVSSYLSHMLSTHYLLCYGETTSDALHVPLYLSRSVETNDRVGGVASIESNASSSGNSAAGSEVKAAAPEPRSRVESMLTIDMFTRYLKNMIRRGQRYQVTSKNNDGTAGSENGAPLLSPQQGPPAADTNTAHSDAEEGTHAAVEKSALLTTQYYPFWTANQPWTSAEYTVLCHTIARPVEQLLREYAPAAALKVQPDLLRYLVSPKLPVTEGRQLLQHLFSHVDPASAHPALCFSPSYGWTQHEKSRMWQMRYIDLGTQARAADIRHTRSLLGGTAVTQQTSEEGAILFDAATQSWATQSTFPLPPSLLLSPGASAADTSADGQMGAEAAATGSPKLKVLTWNVMFDRYSGQPTPLGMPGIDWCSPKRYPVLAKVIEQEDADVVGMQEVELAFAEYLAAQPWCRARYIMSCRPSSSILDPWGVLLLVRRGADAWPVQKLTHLNIPAWSGHVSLMPVVTLDLSSRQLTKQAKQPSSARTRLVNVCAMHLLAPYLKAHETARTGQDQTLRHCLTRQLHGDTLVMGDFNDWPGNEFNMPVETRYVECWPIVHPGDYGKTMDESNTFCKLKIEEIFFGRSDKLFLRSGGGPTNAPPLLRPVEAHLVGTRSVNQENGNHDAPAYLFPSDHYGVSMTFQVMQR